MAATVVSPRTLRHCAQALIPVLNESECQILHPVNFWLSTVRTRSTPLLWFWAVGSGYLRLGITYRSHLQGSTTWPLTMWQTGCPETSVTHYHSTLCNISEELRYHLHDVGSLQSNAVDGLGQDVEDGNESPCWKLKPTSKSFSCWYMQVISH